VRASGTYQGPVAAGGATVTAETDHSVTAEDLAMQKSVAPTAFVAGGVATYSLVLRSGEYRQVTGIAVTDVLPNGVCPLSASQNYAGGAPADCAPEPGFAPTNATIDAVTQHPDGGGDGHRVRGRCFLASSSPGRRDRGTPQPLPLVRPS